MRRELTCPPTAALDTDSKRIARRFSETQDQTVREFPIFETPRVGSGLKGVRGDPIDAAHGDVQRKIAALARAIRNIQESNASRSTQELSRGSGEEIAAQLGDVYRDLPYSLAGIHQIRYACRFCYSSQRFHRLHETRVRGHPSNREQPHSRVAKQVLHRLRISASAGKVGGAAHFHSMAPCQRKIRELIRDIVISRCDDDISRLEIECRKGLKERHRRILNDGDISWLRAQELGDMGVGFAYSRFGIVGAFVTAKVRFALQVT